MKIESLSIDELTQKQREYNKTLETKKALMEAEGYERLVKEKERLEKVTQEGLVNVLLSSKLERVKADILKIEEESEKKEKALLQSRYESGQAYENMAKYAKDINKFLKETNSSIKGIEPETGFSEYVEQLKDSYSEAKKVVEQFGGSIADTDNGIVDISSGLGVDMSRLLGQSRILSQLKGELGAYLSIYAVQRFISEMIRVRGEYQMQQTALSAIIGEATKAEEIFGRIQALGLLSPFSTLDLVGYVKQLAAFKVETNELFDTTKALDDISSELGVDMSRLVLAFGQVRAASVLRGTEVRQFTEAGIPLVDELAKKFTELNGQVVTTGEVFDLISTRQVPFEMVRDILFEMTEAGGMFYNMQEI